ncbi:PEP-CTERM sorting domain-containing protein [Gloeothece verrucosa]|uniref:PEP-CTERM protein-sorting domain-containing protein n=1 Tax=Gloeothece verrucosa (strain PCC 7822) TaxID=497965 RepID=E0UL44_GLOV7|nr:PEP-CTERM sorting domain-containing protein [Gloeothece verrucosa]ADN17674.1 hypothetical protein Cyan7822_5820 [Gloeothece verrucosa PCC 7822]
MKKYTKVLVPIFVGSIVSVFGSVSAASAYTIYSKYSDWQQAVSGSPISFEDFSNPKFRGRKTVLPFSTGIVSTGYDGTQDNVIFGGNSWAVKVAGDIGVDGNLYQGWTEIPNADRTKYPNDYYNSITWKFPTAVQGFFGTFLDTTDGGGVSVTLNYDDKTSESINFLDVVNLVNKDSTRPRSMPGKYATGDVIFGITTGKSFTSMTFTTAPYANAKNYENGYLIDNFSFAAAPPPVLKATNTAQASVPEPLTVLGTATAMIFGAWFKQTNSKKISSNLVEDDA